jgi:hypothetical protein
MKRYFVMFLQLNLIFLALGGVVYLLLSDLPWLLKGPLGASGFALAMTLAFACDEYHNKKDKLLQ